MYNLASKLLSLLMLLYLQPATKASPFRSSTFNSLTLSSNPHLSSMTGSPSSSQATVSAQRRNLGKRFWADIGGGWTIEVQDWGLIWPIEHAANIIEGFHTAVWRMVNQEFQFLEEMHQVVLRHGAFQLRFQCEEAPIEWPTVAMLADMMADAANQGWQGTYRVALRHRARGLLITAALTVMWYGDGG